MIRECRAVLLLALVVTVFPSSVRAFTVVPPADSLKAMQARAEVVFIGKVKSVEAIQDPWFASVIAKRVPLEAASAQIQVLRAIKGEKVPDVIEFHHLRAKPARGMMADTLPIHYQLERSNIYLIFADQSGAPGILRQYRSDWAEFEDLGVTRLSAVPVDTTATVETIVWNEYAGRLKSSDRNVVDGGLVRLSDMGPQNPSNWLATGDFDLKKIQDAVAPLIDGGDLAIAWHAVEILGAQSPILYPASRPASGSVATSPLPPSLWRKLAKLADSNRPADLRALAIRALGGVRDPKLQPNVQRWLKDSDARVHAAAALLLAVFEKNSEGAP